MKRNRKIRMKRIICVLLLAIMISIHPSLTVHAADAEWRMMHGEQDALITGTITEITEEGYRVEVKEALWCQQDTAKGRMIPLEEVPTEMIIPEIRYAYTYHERTTPKKGDHIFISVDKKNGDVWEQQWLAMEVSDSAPLHMEFAMPEKMTNSEYAWQIFVASGGQTTSFAFEGSDILYVDGDVVFDRVKYLEQLQEKDNTNEEAVKLEKEEVRTTASSIAVIGGADGPTSVFIAGKIGRGSTATFVAAAALILVIIAAIIRKIMKK